MDRPLEGGCLCGAVRYRVTQPPRMTGYCHCRMCQRNSGAPAVAWATIPAEGFAFLTGTPQAYRSSTAAERLFCPICGSYVLFRTVEGSDEVSLNTATLDDPATMPPAMHIWHASRIPWFETQDALPRYEESGPG